MERAVLSDAISLGASSAEVVKVIVAILNLDTVSLAHTATLSMLNKNVKTPVAVFMFNLQ